MKLLASNLKNNVLHTMETLLQQHGGELIAANEKDLSAFNKDDQALYDRLVVDEKKVAGMIAAVKAVRLQDDPVNKEISSLVLDNGLKVNNRTAPFGTILIIYESRPDVTIEAAVLAFKANNRIFLKGGKEALHSNTFLVELWHKALEKNGLSKDYIQLLNLNREETQAFLKTPPVPLDLIVPRGGERLITFVKQHAQCAVLVSGRGNNFLYVHEDADWEMTLKVALNAKTHKISACNALDKILINAQRPDFEKEVQEIAATLKTNGVVVLVDKALQELVPDAQVISNPQIWKEEFLAMKCCLGAIGSMPDAIQKINDNSGGHSATIMTPNEETALVFMHQVDCAAVYQNASTRFTDGGQMGVGAELAISTDKLHHRGPLGLKQLVTNKYYVFGNGQIRE